MKTLPPFTMCALATAAFVSFASPAFSGDTLPQPVSNYLFTNQHKVADTTGRFGEMHAKGDVKLASGGRTLSVDDGAMSCYTFPTFTDAFSVAVWFRPHAYGAKAITRDWINGMVVNFGSGYTDGWRILIHNTERFLPVFEVGREQGSVSVESSVGVSTSAWHCVGATWERDASGTGGVMRVYLDGVLTGERTRDVPPRLRSQPNIPFSVGYTDFGVGSMKMDIASATLFDTALTPDEMKNLFLSANIGQTLAEENANADFLLHRAYLLREAGRTNDAERVLMTVVRGREFPVTRRAMAASELLAAREINKFPEWKREYMSASVRAYLDADNVIKDYEVSQILRAPDLPPHLREELLILTGQMREHIRVRFEGMKIPERTVYVSPDGNDDADGTKEKPFRTLPRARDYVREFRRTHHGGKMPEGGFAICLMPGTYPVTETLRLTAEDSGTPDSPLVFYACQATPTMLDGGLHLPREKFAKVTDPEILKRLPEPEFVDPFVGGDVICVDLSEYDIKPQGAFGMSMNERSVLFLYEDFEPLRFARWPNITGDYFETDGTWVNDAGKYFKGGKMVDEAARTFEVGTERIKKWVNAERPMAHGYWKYSWADLASPVKIDAENDTMSVLNEHGYGLADNPEFNVFNILDELDAHGEWVIENGKLYVLPKNEKSDFTLTHFDKPFVQIDGAEGIVFKGIEFRHGRSDAIHIFKSRYITFDSCHINAMGGIAVWGENTPNLTVNNCRIRHMGYGALYINAGDRKTLVPSGVQIMRNQFHDLGLAAHTYVPGILMYGCGAHISGNSFSVMPSSAMRIEGNDHIVEYNHMDNCVLDSDDQGAIDMWGDASYRGCVFRYNTFKNIGARTDNMLGRCAIRFDDRISGMLVYKNTFENAAFGIFGGVQIHGGQHNIVDSNIFIGGDNGISFSPWGKERWQRDLDSDESKNLLYKQVDITSPLYQTRYSELHRLRDDVDKNSLWRNTFINVPNMFKNLPPQTDAVLNHNGRLDN